MRQVLPVVGAAVGAFIGGPAGAQWGWVIGSVVGNVVDPQVIKGPSIGDIAQQTSQEGVPRPIVFGLSQPISGNIVACSQPRIVTKKQSSGKGGPTTETQSVFRTYAIAICEGPITGLLRVWANGKLVYDARPGHEFAGNDKFLQNSQLFLGTYDQLPSSRLQAVFGVANTPAMRGTAYIAWHDIDLTSQGGAVPQYVFQVQRCESSLVTTPPYVLEFTDAAGIISVIPRQPFPEQEDYTFVDITAMPGSLRTAAVMYADWPVDFFGLNSVAALAGTLFVPAVKYDKWIPDYLGVTLVAPQAGILRQVVITYTNWPVDHVGTQTVTPLSGVLA